MVWKINSVNLKLQKSINVIVLFKVSKKKTESKVVMTKNGKIMPLSKCAVSDSKKLKFIKSKNLVDY